MYTTISAYKRLLLGFLLMISGIGFTFSQDTIPATEPETTEVPQKSYAKPAFESGICMDQQTTTNTPAHTLEFVLQHRFGTIQNGISDIYGIWGASNIRFGLNFTITKDLMVGFGTTKNNRLQDFQLKYNIVRQGKNGGFPVNIAYYFDLSINANTKDKFGDDYNFKDRLAYYNEFLFSRRINGMFSAQVGLSYTHFNKVDKTLDTNKYVVMNDAFAIALLGRIKLSPQSSITLAIQQPIILNYDPAFIVKAGKNWMELPKKKAPYPNFSLGWEVSTSTHAFHVFLTAAQGIVPSEIVMHNTNNFFNGYILVGFNLTRLWSF